MGSRKASDVLVYAVNGHNGCRDENAIPATVKVHQKPVQFGDITVFGDKQILDIIRANRQSAVFPKLRMELRQP